MCLRAYDTAEEMTVVYAPGECYIATCKYIETITQRA